MEAAMTDTTTLERTTPSATTILDHWVDGAAWAGQSTRTSPVFNPALGTVQKEVRSLVDLLIANVKA